MPKTRLKELRDHCKLYDKEHNTGDCVNSDRRVYKHM